MNDILRASQYEQLKWHEELCRIYLDPKHPKKIKAKKGVESSIYTVEKVTE